MIEADGGRAKRLAGASVDNRREHLDHLAVEAQAGCRLQLAEGLVGRQGHADEPLDETQLLSRRVQEVDPDDALRQARRIEIAGDLVAAAEIVVEFQHGHPGRGDCAVFGEIRTGGKGGPPRLAPQGALPANGCGDRGPRRRVPAPDRGGPRDLRRPRGLAFPRRVAKKEA